MLLSNAAIKNRTTVIVLMFLIIIAGVYCYVTLPREAEPDIKIPNIMITTSYRGVSPEDIETSVTMKIEEQLNGLNGVKEIRSSSAEGLSTIIVEFLPDVDEKDAKRDVKDRVDLARKELPTNNLDFDDPVVTEINLAEFPIMMINVSGDLAPSTLKFVAERLEEEIESNVPGILDVTITGDLEREIRIEMDPDRVAAYNLSLTELSSLLQSENVNISAGGLETPGTKFNVRIPAQFVKPAEVQYLQVGVRDGRPIYLTDVARVRDTFKDRGTYSRLDGAASLTVSVQKRIGANIITLTDGVKKILEEFRVRSPNGIEFKITLDKSDDIRSSVSDLENNLFSALVLVAGVLMVFMGIRTSSIVALAIPLSMLLTFSVTMALGYTLNMVVLFGLILAMGMLVDNAIVIVENIYRHKQMGLPRVEAAMKGAGEVAWPVISSTATTLAAFSPILFWPGVIGDFMKYLPITLIITLSCSLFVALVISPTICSLISGGKVRKIEAGTHHPFIGGYRALLGWSLRHRAVTLIGAVLMFASVIVSYDRFGRGIELFPDVDPKRALINIRCPQGTNIRETNRIAGIIEERIEPFRADLKHVITTIGSVGSEMAAFGASGGPHTGNITLVFHDFDTRPRDSAVAIAEMRKVLDGIPGAEIKLEKGQEGPAAGDPVSVRIIGRDFKELQDLSEQAREEIEKTDGVINLRSDYEGARPELPFIPGRTRIRDAEINTYAIGQYLKAGVFGKEVGKYRQFNDEYDITLRMPLKDRKHIQDLMALHAPNNRGEPVPLSSLGKFDYAGGFGTISRVNQKHAITLSAGVRKGLNEDKVLKDVQSNLEPLKRNLPIGYEIKYAGKQEDQEEAQDFLLKAFVVALLLIVIILLMQFNTLSAPLIIMTTVILSLIGVLAGLLIFDMPFGTIMTGIGVISLAGVVVNNAIVLLDYTRRLQKRGMEVIEAAIQAGATRLRPVLLTAGTTILGLIPMATGVSFDIHTFQIAWRSESSQWWSSMAIAVIFGLGVATILTLVVVPALYVSLYRMASRFGLGGLHRPGEAESKPALELEDY
ncbi:MAG: efflux RND transporter permease subunit [Phycisphaerae bacterium]|jgi:multidrug efflux pump subunit AcrB|nr:efflux RND transporter permease subunit [Phycisphaerae bacterium]